MTDAVEIHLPDDLTKQVIHRATELNITTSEFIRHAVRNEISRFDRRHERRRTATFIQDAVSR